MQICTSPQTDNHTNIPPLSFLQARCPSCHPPNSIKELNKLKTINECLPKPDMADDVAVNVPQGSAPLSRICNATHQMSYIYRHASTSSDLKQLNLNCLWTWTSSLFTVTISSCICVCILVCLSGILWQNGWMDLDDICGSRLDGSKNEAKRWWHQLVWMGWQSIHTLRASVSVSSFCTRNPEDGEMSLLVLAHPGCPRQSPESHKMVVHCVPVKSGSLEHRQ